MKLILEPTPQTATIEAEGGVPVRIWRGETESGTPVHAFVALVAAPDGACLAELDATLSAAGPVTVAAETPATPAGLVVSASDPRIAGVRELCDALTALANQLVEDAGPGAVLDALANVYLDQLVHRCGGAGATAHLDGLKRLVPTIAASHQCVVHRAGRA